MEHMLDSVLESLTSNDKVKMMRMFNQHGDVSCFEHSYSVAKYSYYVCKFLGLDYESAARGAMLHDFCLYSWKEQAISASEHLRFHPMVALECAASVFDLSVMERDIIEKHMWPVTFPMPKYAETLVVSLMDKLSAMLEASGYMTRRIRRAKNMHIGFIIHCIRSRRLYSGLY